MLTTNSVELALSERIDVVRTWCQMKEETERTMETQPVYVTLWERLGARLSLHEWPPLPEQHRCDKPIEIDTDSCAVDSQSSMPSSSSSDDSYQSSSDTPSASSTTSKTSMDHSDYRNCYVCDEHQCPIQQPDLSKITVPSRESLPDWTAHRLQWPDAYAFNEEYAAIRLSIASAASRVKGGGTRAVKGASRSVQLQSFTKLTGATGLWAKYDLMASVWLSFTVVSLHRSAGMQPIMALQKAAMACTIPDYAGTPDGEDQQYAGSALRLAAKGFDTIASHNKDGVEGAAMIAAVLTRPGYGRHSGATDDTSAMPPAEIIALNKSAGVDRNTWLHMRWYDGGVVPYFMCHDWSLRNGAIGRLTSPQSCPFVDSCYDISIWLNDLSDYALDRTIGEGGNSLVYALSQSGACEPSTLADFCSDVLSRVGNCRCDSTLHDMAGDIAVGFTAMYALGFRYRGLENAWLARKVSLSGVVQHGWLIQGGSMDEKDRPRVPYKSDWKPLTTTLPTHLDVETAKTCWQARCGWLAVDGPGNNLITHIVSRLFTSQTCDERSVGEALERLWSHVEPAIAKLGGDSAAIYQSVQMLVLSVLEWPAIFASSPAHQLGQCAVRDKVALENVLLESAAYGLWCAGTGEASELVRFLTGVVACVSELTIVATYRRIPLLWSEDMAGWTATEHMDCTHAMIS